MKLDYDDFARDRGDEFQTDDEENEAERVCVHEYDTESEVTSSPRRPSDSNMDPNNPTWPQTYRYDI